MQWWVSYWVLEERKKFKMFPYLLWMISNIFFLTIEYFKIFTIPDNDIFKLNSGNTQM
jgi:hypothetical protein